MRDAERLPRDQGAAAVSGEPHGLVGGQVGRRHDEQAQAAQGGRGGRGGLQARRQGHVRVLGPVEGGLRLHGLGGVVEGVQVGHEVVVDALLLEEVLEVIGRRQDILREQET